MSPAPPEHDGLKKPARDTLHPNMQNHTDVHIRQITTSDLDEMFDAIYDWLVAHWADLNTRLPNGHPTQAPDWFKLELMQQSVQKMAQDRTEDVS